MENVDVEQAKDAISEHQSGGARADELLMGLAAGAVFSGGRRTVSCSHAGERAA